MASTNINTEIDVPNVPAHKLDLLAVVNAARQKPGNVTFVVHNPFHRPFVEEAAGHGNLSGFSVVYRPA